MSEALGEFLAGLGREGRVVPFELAERHRREQHVAALPVPEVPVVASPAAVVPPTVRLAGRPPALPGGLSSAAPRVVAGSGPADPRLLYGSFAPPLPPLGGVLRYHGSELGGVWSADRLTPQLYGAVGDGVADDGPAFVAVAAAGGDIYVPPGDYKLGDATIVPASNTRIWATPGTATLLKAPLVDSYKHPFIQFTDRKHVTIEGLIFDEASGGQREQAIIVLSTGPANSSGIRIAGNTFRNCGVYFGRWTERVVVAGNLFTSSGAGLGAQAIAGIGTGGEVDPITGGTTTDYGPVREVWIDGNHFEDYRFEAIDINWDTRNVWITNNYIRNVNTTADAANEAIDVGGGDGVLGWCEGITVADNVIEWTAARISHGILFKQNTRNSVITGNTITNPYSGGSTVGIVVHDGSSRIEITNNNITGFDYGVLASAGSRITIADNTIRDPAVRGIQVDNVADGALISGNNISTTKPTTPVAGIYTFQMSGFRIIGNAVTGGFIGANGTGVYTDATSADGVVSGNISAGNLYGYYIRSPRTAVTGNIAKNNGSSGFHLAGTHMTVIGNEAYDNAQTVLNQFGFNLLAGANYAIITDNKSFDTQGVPTQNGFLFAASDRVIFNGNIAFPVKTTSVSGTGTLTGSLVGVAGNL